MTHACYSIYAIILSHAVSVFSGSQNLTRLGCRFHYKQYAYIVFLHPIPSNPIFTNLKVRLIRQYIHSLWMILVHWYASSNTRKKPPHSLPCQDCIVTKHIHPRINEVYDGKIYLTQEWSSMNSIHC